MNYELAKELKDAGFPQMPKEGRFFMTESNAILDTTQLSNSITLQRVYLPTLSELIEACGDNFGKLDRNNGMWRATSYKTDYYKEMGMDNLSEVLFGSTPEESVARLWLALNKK